MRTKGKILKFLLAIIFVSVVLCDFIPSSLATDTDGAIEISFKNDKNMYEKMYEELGDKVISHNASTQSITIKTDEVVVLDLSNSNIKDISGIENFTNLTYLNISNNAISDISKLASLKNLKELQIYGNSINNVSTINNNLTNLEKLSLAKNYLTGADLNNLTNLKELDLSHNSLTSTSSVSKLTNLEILNLYDNRITDISGLANLTNLKELNLGENTENGGTISNLSPLKNLVNLKKFDFSENRNVNIASNISNLVKLEELSLQGNSLTDTEIAYLENLTNLKILNLYDNRIQTPSKLFGLTNLEELILGRNNIRDITSLYNGDTLLLSSKIKKLDLSTNTWLYSLYDGEKPSNNTTRIDKNAEIIKKLIKDIDVVNYEYLTDTTNLPHYDNGTAYVTYEDFGARADGKYDDFIAIRNAHLYANEHGYEVRGTAGKTYHIFKYYEDAVIVYTSVDWKNAKIIIHDEEIEKYSGRYKQLFTFTNIDSDDTVTINNPSWTINKETKKLTGLSSELSTLNSKGYKTYLVQVVNANKQQYKRYGTSQSSDQQDYFIIDSEGNVLNDIQWDFDSITSLTIYPIPNTEINIRNANFISNALNSQSETPYTRSGKQIYFYRNLNFNKIANLNVSNIHYSLSYEANKDELSGSYLGFLYTNIAANVNITDCTLFARKYSYNGRSTYGIYLNSTVNAVVDNLKSNNINDEDRWGVVATNFTKDIVFKNCTLNRIDAHQGIYNLTVDNCNIGYHGLTMTGQGTLNVIDTTIETNAFITLRNDYGSTWNGEVNIIDSTFKVIGPYNAKLFNSIMQYDGNKFHDFGYDCKLPNLNVYNLTIDMTNAINNNFTFFYINGLNSNYKAANDAYLKKYLNNDILINGYTFKNANGNVTVNLFANANAKDYFSDSEYNYVLEDVSITDSNAKELVNIIDETEDYVSKDNLYLKINFVKETQNTVTIYKDGEVILNETTINDFLSYNFTENGNYKIEVTSLENTRKYTGTKVYEFSIDVKEIVKIEVTTLPTKTTYIQNKEELDLTGGIITVTYEDGSKETINLDAPNINVSGFDNSELGTQTITVEYNGKTTTFDVEVVAEEESEDPENPGESEEPKNPGDEKPDDEKKDDEEKEPGENDSDDKENDEKNLDNKEDEEPNIGDDIPDEKDSEEDNNTSNPDDTVEDNEDTPNTYDSIISNIILNVISLVLFVGSIVVLIIKKKFF